MRTKKTPPFECESNGGNARTRNPIVSTAPEPGNPNRIHVFGREPVQLEGSCPHCEGAGYILPEGALKIRWCNCPVGRYHRTRKRAEAAGLPLDALLWEPLEVAAPELLPIHSELSEWVRGFKPGRTAGCLLLGPSGTGKTRLLEAVAAFRLEEGNSLKWWNWPELQGRVRATWKSRDETEEEILEAALSVDVLALDDLGAGSGQSSEWTESLLYRILNTAAERRRPAILATANATMEEIRGIYGDRATGRLIECTHESRGGRHLSFGEIPEFWLRRASA